MGKDLFIKFESIEAKVITLFRECIFDEICLTLEFDRQGNFQMLLNYYLCYHLIL